ncbi:unnamed protein product [Vitrella brassicaformis CCMP3155]|uniref:Uncharacterized protein n=1 Tax=Vitrella brassicaformis (strain CCMP3155) TaxID=1169540 RepID=A0A0G4FDE0_VITBC|nr:unnamed protein product [Vitrella brassicaformis CCMP3155]|eukprot:CEM11254.1 unnamed protein product [Vitrella brassicaformis CCMP3155]
MLDTHFFTFSLRIASVLEFLVALAFPYAFLMSNKGIAMLNGFVLPLQKGGMTDAALAEAQQASIESIRAVSAPTAFLCLVAQFGVLFMLGFQLRVSWLATATHIRQYRSGCDLLHMGVLFGLIWTCIHFGIWGMASNYINAPDAQVAELIRGPFLMTMAMLGDIFFSAQCLMYGPAIFLLDRYQPTEVTGGVASKPKGSTWLGWAVIITRMATSCAICGRVIIPMTWTPTLTTPYVWLALSFMLVAGACSTAWAFTFEPAVNRQLMLLEGGQAKTHSPTKRR